MVDPVSHGVPRAPWYSGTLSGSHQPFAYGDFTLSSGSFQSPSAKLMISYSPDGPQPIPTTPLNPHQATLAGLTPGEFGLFRVRSPLLTESLNCFLFLGVLRWFTSPRSLRPSYEFT